MLSRVVLMLVTDPPTVKNFNLGSPISWGWQVEGFRLDGGKARSSSILQELQGKYVLSSTQLQLEKIILLPQKYNGRFNGREKAIVH
jgi:hypothetical protein